MAILLIAGLGLPGCSSSQKQQEASLEEQVQAQPEANTPEAIHARVVEAFDQAPGLTNEQKGQLSAIYNRTFSEAMMIRKEIGQSKSLMFELLATKDYRSKDVELLKKKITQLDQKRLNLMFKSLDDVQKVVGYGKDKEEIYRRLRDLNNWEHPITRK